jgi:hypothetical protein
MKKQSRFNDQKRRDEIRENILKIEMNLRMLTCKVKAPYE